MLESPMNVPPAKPPRWRGRRRFSPYALALMTVIGGAFHGTACAGGHCSVTGSSGPAQCTARLLRYQCEEGDGCTWGSRCVYGGCSSYATEETCGAQAGCTWFVDACAPEPGLCASAGSTSDECIKTQGCIWGIACTGQSNGRACTQLGEDECDSRHDCMWESGQW